jgi:serine/threonine protein kinase
VLSVLHGEHSVVHRDIKPENIFLTAGGASQRLFIRSYLHTAALPQPIHRQAASLQALCSAPAISQLPALTPLPALILPRLPADELRLGDFGLAIQQSGELPFLRAGTLDYMAPEVGAGAVQQYTAGGLRPGAVPSV